MGTFRFLVFAAIGISVGWGEGGLVGAALGFAIAWVLWAVTEMLIFAVKDALRGFPVLRRR